MRPILYSFRRCPYAMRARLAIQSAGIEVELREILLRDKPAQMLEASPKGTVPVLLTPTGVIDESRDIMSWALGQHDPEGLLEMPPEGQQWISEIEGPFKSALDRYKYSSRYEDAHAETERDIAAQILQKIEPMLRENAWIYGENPSFADFATITFIRQYAMVDRTWFDAQNWRGVQRWLDHFLASERFQNTMAKYVPWRPGDKPVLFGGFPVRAPNA